MVARVESLYKVARGGPTEGGFWVKTWRSKGWTIHTSKGKNSRRREQHMQSLWVHKLVWVPFPSTYSFPVMFLSLPNCTSVKTSLSVSLLLPQSLPLSILGLFQIQLLEALFWVFTNSVALRIGCLLNLIMCLQVCICMSNQTKSKPRKGWGRASWKGPQRAGIQHVTWYHWCLQKCKDIRFHLTF